MAVDPAGREAVTEWTLLENLKNAALLDVHILTGRTHQIRVHMQSLHHPVAGDPIYGQKNGVKAPRLMLHAYTLSFTHPRTGERLSFTAPPPEAFTAGCAKVAGGPRRAAALQGRGPRMMGERSAPPRLRLKRGKPPRMQNALLIKERRTGPGKSLFFKMLNKMG